MPGAEPTHWEVDCLKWRGRVLTGIHGHWCDDWDGLPVDETCEEFPCRCYPDLRAATGRSP